VAIAEIDSAVRKVIDVEIVTISRVAGSPTFPTTQPKRRYMITPRIVRIDGVNTPPKVPRPAPRPVTTSCAAGGRAVAGSDERWESRGPRDEIIGRDA